MKKSISLGSKDGGPESANGRDNQKIGRFIPPQPLEFLSPEVAQVRTLTEAELKDLEECEQTIRKGMPTLINIGDALIKIRKNRLYRDRYSTFEEYCRDTFEYSKSHANRLIDAAHIVNVLTPIGVNRETIRESQIRPLVGLNEKEVKAAWTKANKSADGTKLTARHVRLAAAQFKTSAPKPQKKLSKSSKTSKPLPQILKLITKVEVAIQKQTLDDALDLLAKLRRVFTH